jgi:hypothetical protein
VGGVGGVVVTGGLVGGPGGGHVVGPGGGGAVGGGQPGGGGPQSRRPSKRPFALQIVDPVTGKDVVEEMLSTEETHSSDSTPQPPVHNYFISVLDFCDGS